MTDIITKDEIVKILKEWKEVYINYDKNTGIAISDTTVKFPDWTNFDKLADKIISKINKNIKTLK